MAEEDVVRGRTGEFPGEMAEEDVVRGGRTGEFPGEMLLLPSAAALPKCLVCTRRTTVSSGCCTYWT